MPYLFTAEETGTWVDNNSTECNIDSGYWQVQLPPEGSNIIATLDADPYFSPQASTEFATTFLTPGEYNIYVTEFHQVCQSDKHRLDGPKD